jgi:hypothetical protein
MERPGLSLKGLSDDWLPHGGDPEGRHLQYACTLHLDCLLRGAVVEMEVEQRRSSKLRVPEVVGSLSTSSAARQ